MPTLPPDPETWPCTWLIESRGEDGPVYDEFGTGAYQLDQSWHVGWLFIAALIIAA